VNRELRTVNEHVMPRLHGIIETSLYVDDLPRATAFYQDVLGLRLLDGSPRMSALDVDGRSLLLLFKRGGTIDPVDVPGGIIPGHDGSGTTHFAFAIDPADFDHWEEWLLARGVAIESRVTWPRGGRSLYFRDPDGNAVELATPGTWETF
jgi:catechol 2,3-dioxygenase-like lactoylglutathione lyase family enzyme